MRILILQYGDYGEAYRRFQSGGAETYRDQRHSVNFVASLTPRHEVATVAVCDRGHDEELAPGLRSIGVPVELAWQSGWIRSLFDRFNPEAFICRTPNRVALAWAAKKRVPTLAVFADIISNQGLRSRLDNWRLGRVLRRCFKPCVANHSLSASWSLTLIGVRPDQIVPYEWQQLAPSGHAKDAPPSGRPFRLFFAGMLIESKGVGDCIEAVAIARAARAEVELTLAGSGEVDGWTAFAERHGVGAHVHVLGLIPAERVRQEMRQSDAVLVPSRYTYAEGLPNTIFEALASRSPLIASDHPAFVDRLRPEVDSLRFKAGDPKALARQVERLVREPDLYARLSRESASALSRLTVGIEWTDLISRFIDDPLSSRDWVKRYSLAALANRPGETDRSPEEHGGK
jgi:glycosyltransferase involved in cell wall biosynthesis